ISVFHLGSGVESVRQKKLVYIVYNISIKVENGDRYEH
ncbi:MAG: hypothetical protein K0R90_305, partial [Oscillospiraceae bacterium]|nr:hypothetical protein [Oscillospiraceae bacterium]